MTRDKVDELMRKPPCVRLHKEGQKSGRCSDKERYIKEAPMGTIVAFVAAGGKTKSAMIVNRSSSGRKLKLETKYGANFIVPYEDVIWVRTTKRWPTGVLRQLKGEGELHEE